MVVYAEVRFWMTNTSYPCGYAPISVHVIVYETHLQSAVIAATLDCDT